MGSEMCIRDSNKDFKQFILKTVKQSQLEHQRSEACIQDNRGLSCQKQRKELLESVRYYGLLLMTLRSHIFKSWAQTRARSEILKNCLDGQPMGSVFSNSSRELTFKNQNLICRTLSTSWSHNVDRLEADTLKKGSQSSGLSSDEYGFLIAFKKSILAHALGQGLLATSNFSDEETLIQRLRRPLAQLSACLLYTSPSPRDLSTSRMPSSA